MARSIVLHANNWFSNLNCNHYSHAPTLVPSRYWSMAEKCGLDVSLIHPPAWARGSLSFAKECCQNRQNFDCPAMHGGVINENTALLHHFIDVAQAQRVGHVPAHTGHIKKVVKPFEDPVQCAWSGFGGNRAWQRLSFIFTATEPSTVQSNATVKFLDVLLRHKWVVHLLVKCSKQIDPSRNFSRVKPSSHSLKLTKPFSPRNAAIFLLQSVA